MSIGIVYLRPLRVLFVRKTGRYADSAHGAWAELLGLLDEHGVRQEFKAGYGVMHDDPETSEEAARRYDACVSSEVAGDSKLAQILPTQTIVGGVYLRLNHDGAAASIKPLLSRLRTEEVARRGLTLDAKRPFMEIYTRDPGNLDNPTVRVDLAVPVIT